MDSTMFLPTDIAAWLVRYGLFTALAAFVALLFLVFLKPFWNWLSGASETNDRLKLLVELERKVLTELEVLNKTLSRPLKKRSLPNPESPGVPEKSEPMPVNEERKKALLEALARTQSEREKLKIAADKTADE